MLVSCADDGDSLSSTQEEQAQEGQFLVNLVPVNPNVLAATGQGLFSIYNDEFNAKMVINDSMAVNHIQQIYIGTRCPEIKDDINRDGIIDYVEAKVAVGGSLIPLDEDLSSQSAGNTYPEGPNYSYDKIASYITMLTDLKLPDLVSDDDLVKLGENENLNLEGKIVQVHGVSVSTILPITAQAPVNLTPQQSLPILCGVITRLQK
jgi:hypothetical protein